MGQHIAQLGPHKLALGKLAVVLELDKLAAVKLVVLDKLVVEPIAALVLDTVAAALELNKQLVAGLVVDRQLVARLVVDRQPVVALVLSKQPAVEREPKQLGVVALLVAALAV